MSSPKPKQGTLLTHSLSFKHLDVTCTPQTPRFPTLTRPSRTHPPAARGRRALRAPARSSLWSPARIHFRFRSAPPLRAAAAKMVSAGAGAGFIRRHPPRGCAGTGSLRGRGCVLGGQAGAGASPSPDGSAGPRGKGKGRSGAFVAGCGVCAAAVTSFSPSPPGERAENSPDLLQEMREAPAAQGHAVQEGEGLALRAG